MTRLQGSVGLGSSRDAVGTSRTGTLRTGTLRTGTLPTGDVSRSRTASLAGDRFAGKRIHLIGIGGCGMSGAAGVLLRRGAIVTGSDRMEGEATQRLVDGGARITFEQRAENVPVDADLVVISAAIKEGNPELREARRRGLDVLKYCELLGMLMADREGVAIAGTHGKSTTTAMTTFILKQAGFDPSFVIGATVNQLGGGSGVGGGAQFVAEACEFDRSFLNLTPRFGTILNIEEDHLDCYRDIEEIIEAFTAFGSRVRPDGVLLVNYDDRSAMAAAENVNATVETFGFKKGADWRAENLKLEAGRYVFDWMRGADHLAHVTMALPGRHNVCNALAAGALCLLCGVSAEAVARGIETFRGADRRLSLRGKERDITVVDDYAHHPTEIQVTLRAAKDLYQPKRMWVVFQPHQHSRTRFLLNDFARSFGLADMVVVPKIYFVRDSEKERDLIGSTDLVEKIHAHGGEALHIASLEAIVEHLKSELRAGDLVLTMGAGDVWKIADDLVSWLGIDRRT